MNAVTHPMNPDLTIDLTPITVAERPSVDTMTASVPLKPTTRMLTEGARAGGVTVETVWKIYLAMLRAAD